MAGELVVVPLSQEVFDLDFAAYRSSPKAIMDHSAGRWPVDDLSREEAQRLIDVHESERAAGVAYAYSILSADRTRELGCAYLRPLSGFLTQTGTRLHATTLDPNRTAIVTFWLIDDQAARPSTARMLDSLRRWLHHWTAADLVFRCLPSEVASVDALSNDTGLSRLVASRQELPYLWFADQARTPTT